MSDDNGGRCRFDGWGQQTLGGSIFQKRGILAFSNLVFTIQYCFSLCYCNILQQTGFEDFIVVRCSCYGFPKLGRVPTFCNFTGDVGDVKKGIVHGK